MGRVRNLWHRALERMGVAPSDEVISVMGRTLRLMRGTFRTTPDYDDAWFLACAIRASVIFDVGANVGYDAILALAFSKVECVALIEANPRALARAAHNIGLNSLNGRVRLISGFASDTSNDRVTFWTTGAGAAGSVFSKHAHTAAARGDALLVPTTTLDLLCAALQMQPDFVKVDVEGAESRVLAGSRQIAARRRARFLVEMHSNPDLPMLDNARLVREWCADVAYSAWYLRDRVLLESASQISHRGRCHLLLQPNDWAFPTWLEPIRQSAALQEAFVPSDGPEGGL